MKEYIGKVCPFCKVPFRENDDIVLCSSCEMPHHKDCWIENQGCTTFGCLGTIKALSEKMQDDDSFDLNIMPIYCKKCGAQNEEGNNFCEKCGESLTAQKSGSPQYTHYTPSAQGAGSALAYAAAQQQATQYYPAQSSAYQQNTYQQNTYQQNAYQQNAYQQNAYQQNAYQQGGAYQQNAYQQGGAYQQNAYQQNAYQQGYSYNGISQDEINFVGEKAPYYSQKFTELRAGNKKVSWNWCSFLFGGLWFAYRKMYAYTAICFGIGLVSALLGSLGLVVSIALPICAGIFGNYIYMRWIEKTLQEAWNMQEPMRSQHIASKSGTSTGAVWAAIGIIVGIELIIGLIFGSIFLAAFSYL